MAKKKSSTPLSAAAIEALRGAAYTANSFRLTDDSLPCYPEIKAVVQVLGGRWVRRTGLHEFPEGVDARGLVGSVCDRGEIPPSNPGDFYPTPAAIAGTMLDEEFASRLGALRVCADMDGRSLHFLEPEAGLGAIAAVLEAHMQPGDTLTLVESNPLSAAVLRQRFLRATVVEGDFLGFRPDREFSLILMNPPFARCLYERHIERAFELLGRFGVLAAVAPQGFLRNPREIDFLQFVNRHGGWSLIDGTPFAGVSIPTCIIRLERSPDSESFEQPYEGFSSFHAWHGAAAIGSDGRMLGELSTADDDETQVILQRWTIEMNQMGHYQRMNPEIAAEVLGDLRENGLLEHPEPNKPVPARRPEAPIQEELILT